jgi:hypothetical protein
LSFTAFVYGMKLVQLRRQPKNMQKSKLSLGLVILAIVMVTMDSFAGPPPPSVPDAGSSALLMSLGFAGLAAVRKFMR